jgi:predicted dehydrogenase
MKKINWGIIGLGSIAQKFAEGFAETLNSNLLAAASHDYQKLNNFKKKFNIEEKFLFKNYEDLINCKDVDIVYIALPNSFHFHWVIESIKNNKNILVEKPATLNFEEAKNIKQSLLNKNLFFGEAFMYRYHPQINYLLDMINSNEIGNLDSMESLFGINILTKKKFLFFEKKKKINKEDRKFDKKLGGGCILDLGCYTSSFSLLIGLLANKMNNHNIRLLNIHKKIGETDVDIDSRGEIIFENGFKSKVRASFEKNLGNKSIIKGDKGYITINNTWKGNDNVILTKENKNKVKSFNDNKNIYSYQIEQISKNILNGKNKASYPGMNLDETLLNMKIIEEWLNA